MALTPMEFRSLVRAKGYTLSEAARWFGVSKGRLSQIAADGERAAHFELALWGLPAKRVAPSIAVRRRRYLERLRRPRGAKTWSWEDLFAVGSVFMVTEEQGEHLPEGCEGVVRQVVRGRQGLQVAIEFASGYREVFSAEFLRSPDSFLFANGRVVESRAALRAGATSLETTAGDTL